MNGARTISANPTTTYTPDHARSFPPQHRVRALGTFTRDFTRAPRAPVARFAENENDGRTERDGIRTDHSTDGHDEDKSRGYARRIHAHAPERGKPSWTSTGRTESRYVARPRERWEAERFAFLIDTKIFLRDS